MKIGHITIGEQPLKIQSCLVRVSASPRTPTNYFVMPPMRSIKSFLARFACKDRSIRSWKFPASSMLGRVFSYATHQFQVFRTIIVNNTVDVMDHLFFEQSTAKFFLHYQPMFQYVAAFSGIWMVGAFDGDIPVSLHPDATFPIGV